MYDGKYKIDSSMQGCNCRGVCMLVGDSRAKLMGYNRNQLTKVALICNEWPMTSLPSNLKVELNFYFKSYRLPTLCHMLVVFFFCFFFIIMTNSCTDPLFIVCNIQCSLGFSFYKQKLLSCNCCLMISI